MSADKNKIFKATAWFLAVVVVLSLFLLLAQMMSEGNEFLKTQSLNVVLCLVSAYICYDLFKKYKIEKKKKQIFGILFFALITASFLVYFGMKIFG